MSDVTPVAISDEMEEDKSASNAEAEETIALEPADDDDEQDENEQQEHQVESADDKGEEAENQHQSEENGESAAAQSAQAPQRTPLSDLRPTLRGTFDISTGMWVGEWAMSSEEYETGVRGKFEYKRIDTVPDTDVGKPAPVEGQPPDMYVSGHFTLLDPLHPGQTVDKKENDVLMRFSATPEGNIVVQGYGKNEFGAFTLSGTFDVETSALELYRAYQPRASDNKKSKSKKKSTPSTPATGTASRRTPRPAPKPIAIQNWDNASAIATGPAAAVSQRARRPPSHAVELGEDESRVKTRMLPVIESLLSQDRFKFFHVPVDPVRDNVPNYHDIIKDPMDLGTVKKKLMAGAYQTEEQLAADVNLAFSNAMIFNPVGHIVYETAKTLLAKFEIELNKIISRREAERERKRKSMAAAATAPSKNGKRPKLGRASSARSDESQFSDDESFDSGSAKASTRSKRNMSSMEPAASNAPAENEELRLLRKQVEMMSKQLETLQAVTIQSQRSLIQSQPSYSSEHDAHDVPYTSAPRRPRAAPKPRQSHPVTAAPSIPADLDDDYGVAKGPKPERPLSYQEKRALSQDINKLPADKVQRVLDIIAESGSQMIGDGAEEVEIDIEKLDTQTLKALQKYVREVLRTEKKRAIREGVM